MNAISNSTVYAKESKSDYYLLKFYYLVFLKRYIKEINTWKYLLVIQYLIKFISLF